MIETREQIIAKDAMEVSALVVLTDSEFKILDSKDDNIRKRVDAIADDMAVKWAVEEGGNQHVGSVSRTFGPVVGHNERHEMELIAGKFMEAIRDIDLPAIDEAGGPHQENNEETDEEKLAFVDSILEDEQMIRENFKGFKVFGRIKTLPAIGEVCTINTDTFFEILKTYNLYMHEAKK